MRAMLLSCILVATGWCRAQEQGLIDSQPPPAAEQPPPPAVEPKVVKVTAEGYDKDDALKQALRKALEQGAAVTLAGFSQVENYQLIRDTIYSKAAGIIQDYRVLEGPREIAGGAWEVTIEATVRPDAVAATWGEVQNVLDQIGRPRIMVWIDENIDERPTADSIVASGIEEMFVKAGFDLVSKQAIEAIRKREAADAANEQDAAKLARLAKDAGAHILIRGVANANRAGIEDLYGTAAAFYNCDVQARIYYTDTGRLLASEAIPVTRRGVRARTEFSPQAARAALQAATFPRSDVRREPALAIRLFEAVMEQWSAQISAGGDIELEVAALDFKTFVALKKALAEVEGVRAVEADFTKNTGVFRIKAVIAGQVLAERLTEKPFDGWLEVLDLKPNRIQAKATAPR